MEAILKEGSKNLTKHWKTTAIAAVGFIVMILVSIGKVDTEQGEVIKQAALGIVDSITAIIALIMSIVLAFSKDPDAKEV